MNATYKLSQSKEEADGQLLQLLRITYQASVIAVCLTYLAGQQAYKAGVKTRQAIHWLDEAKLMAAPCWEWPIRFITYAVEEAKASEATLKSDDPVFNEADIEQPCAPLEQIRAAEPAGPDIKSEVKALLEAKSSNHLSGMTIRELKGVAKSLKIPNYGRMNKSKLIAALS